MPVRICQRADAYAQAHGFAVCGAARAWCALLAPNAKFGPDRTETGACVWKVTARGIGDANCEIVSLDRARKRHRHWTVNRQPVPLADKTLPAIERVSIPAEPRQTLITPVSLTMPQRNEPGVCQSPMRSRFFHDDVHVGLGCDDRALDQPTALDGFARMRYHIALPN
jgi:hypothetical protein